MIHWGNSGIRCLFITAICLAYVSASAQVYLNDGFEGAAAFVDRNWPIRNGTDLATAPLQTGINLRSFGEDSISPKVQLNASTSNLVSTRAFTGSKSLKLQSGQKMKVVAGQFPNRVGGPFRVWQFAVSVDGASTALPQGMEVGHFKIDYSNDSTTDLTPDTSVLLRLTANGSGGVDLFCENNARNLGTLTGSSDSWLQVTIVAMDRLAAGSLQEMVYPWVAYDPLGEAYKGPQPDYYYYNFGTGIHIFVDSATAPSDRSILSRASLGSNWGNEDGAQPTRKQDTVEIGWEFVTETSGTIYLDNLYWATGYSSSEEGGMDGEQAARLQQFTIGACGVKDPGIASPIKKVYVISQTHVDIGFNYPPEEIREWCKRWIDQQVEYARTHPGFRYTIEHTWMLENWRVRSTPAQVNELMDLLRSGQFELGAAHSTLHSGKAGVEVVDRLLWNAENYRHMYNIPIDTMLFNDVPGVAWSYPQIMAKSGIKHLVCGLNLFLGGGFNQPYPSYLFRWQGPDASKVLTWSTKNAYNEGFKTYGIPFGGYVGLRKSLLTTALSALQNAQYPYDAVLVMHSADANISQAEYHAAKSWNNTYQNPQIITATPREFFEYMESKYAEQIPTHSGNWTTRWDTGMIVEPRAEKIRKNAQDLIPSAEKAWTIASALGKTPYPTSEFNNAWEMLLTGVEHTGAGAGWPNYYTQQQIDLANQQYWNYGLSCFASTTNTMESGSSALLTSISRPGQESIAVFNSLSWRCTDLVRAKISSSLYAENFKLIDSVTSLSVPYQKVVGAPEILFVAKDVPSVGYKCFDIQHSPAPTPATSLQVGNRYLENSRYRIDLNTSGYITSIFDKKSSMDMTSTNTGLSFNRAVTGVNLKYMGVSYDLTPDPASAIAETGMSGPVAASLKVAYSNYPVAFTRIILYEDLDRIEIVNTVDRTQMQYAPLNVNSRYYGFAFPFNVPGYSQSSIDTAAGWLVPVSNSMPGSFTQSHAIQHAIDMSSPNYGITFSAPDVYIHAFGGFNTSGGFSPPTKPSVFSTFIRYYDEADLIGNDVGTVTVEPGAEPQWDLRYAFRSHARTFDAVEDARFGWQVCTPMLAKHITPSETGKLTQNATSFFSVNTPNVIITDIKKADFGQEGLIVKLQEVAGSSAAVMLDSAFLRFGAAFFTTPLEQDMGSLSVKDQRSMTFDMGSSEIKTLRLILIDNTQVSPRDWPLYR